MGTVIIGVESVLVFGTRAGGDSHFNTQLGADLWTDADGADKDKGLVSATRWLTRLGLVDDNGDELLPSDLDTNVPEDVKIGTYELAIDLLADTSIQDTAAGSGNTKSVKHIIHELFHPK